MTAPGFDIRPFGGLELADAEALHRASFPAAWDRPWSRQSFAEMLAMPGTFGLMARDAGNAALGLIVVRAAADEAEILTIAVAPALRRQGIGAALIAAARTEARGRGARRLHLEVAEDNFAARKLYAGLGFAAVGKRAGYYARGSLGSAAAILMAQPV
ncbi:MAG: ribosomal protein S18-alanine N-acetyltransferase [Reyranellaceae bacterium]